jgi:putative glycosyltransferase (TIGR04348 family)
MRIIVVTPAAPRSRLGNRVTAQRWAAILRGLGHRVRVLTQWRGEPCDVLVALHARRSSPSVARWRRERPGAPLVVALTGTDIYRDLARSRRAAQSIGWATRLVALQVRAADVLAPSARRKTRVIVQSVDLRRRRAPPRRRTFRVCVLAHLREVKDPFRAALAVRALPADSRVEVVHAGSALSAAMARRARSEQARNPRWRWIGDVPRARALALLRDSDAMVLSSRLEGGSGALSEALALGVPVIASRVPGIVGVLGPRHPGLYRFGDTAALARLLRRAETEPAFLARLARAGASRAHLVDPRREVAAWRRLIAELGGARAT